MDLRRPLSFSTFAAVAASSLLGECVWGGVVKGNELLDSGRSSAALLKLLQVQQAFSELSIEFE